MTDAVLVVVAAIAAVGAIAAATISGLALIQATSTHDLINSRMTELLEQTRKLALAEGKKSERERAESEEEA